MIDNTVARYRAQHIRALGYLAEHPSLGDSNRTPIPRERIAKAIGEKAAMALDDMEAARRSFRKAVEEAAHRMESGER